MSIPALAFGHCVPTIRDMSRSRKFRVGDPIVVTHDLTPEIDGRYGIIVDANRFQEISRGRSVWTPDTYRVLIGTRIVNLHGSYLKKI